MFSLIEVKYKNILDINNLTIKKHKVTCKGKRNPHFYNKNDDIAYINRLCPCISV
ncbi:MAG: hypothetical protein K0R80_912 [Clostridia bacterium]|jgi:hypothetical protein|nr:hypothetical protein [Clostridia bacterium]